MKQPQIIALTAVLAVAVGMVGINGASGDIFGLNTSPDVSTSEGQAYKGHVIVKHFDPEGNLLSYQQTDNLINVAGKNCGANLLFGTGFLNCTSPGAFVNIGLTTTLGGGFLETDTLLANECDGTTNVCGAGLDARQVGVVTASQVAASGLDAIAQIQATFTMGSAGPTTINSAGLFDSTTPDTINMFAERQFSTGVALSQNDSIQVTWLITLQ